MDAHKLATLTRAVHDLTMGVEPLNGDDVTEMAIEFVCLLCSQMGEEDQIPYILNKMHGGRASAVLLELNDA